MKQLVDIEVFITGRTDLAVKVHKDEDDYEQDRGVWLPLSQIEIEEKPTSKIAVVTLPVWLAEKKELI
jgi:hypothetical protein